MQIPAKAVLVTDRDHDPAGEYGGKQISLPVAPLHILGGGDALAGQVGGEPRGIVGFGKRDRGRDGAKLLVLLEQPALPEVPPFGTVEHVVEARRAKGLHLLQHAAQVLGREHGIGADLAAGLDQLPPDQFRHLVGGIAAKTADAEAGVVTDHLGEVFDQFRAGGAIAIVDLGEVGPHRLLVGVGIDRERRSQGAVRCALEPFGMLPGQDRILGGVVDHQIHHHRKPPFLGGGGETRDQFVVGALRRALNDRVQPVVVLDRVQAAGETRVMERVDENPVEPHRGDPFEVGLPLVDRPGKQRKKVIDTCSLGGLPHGAASCMRWLSSGGWTPLPTWLERQALGRRRVSAWRCSANCKHRPRACAPPRPCAAKARDRYRDD